jgi:nitrite reductase (NADH) large subunit
VNLSGFFNGKTAEELSLLPEPGYYEKHGIIVHRGERVAAIDAEQRVVTLRSGGRVSYSKLVLATGSYPFVPPMPNNGAPGCFVYRTIEDLEAIRTFAANARTGAVIGGGLLGLEAANALRSLGLRTHVVEFSQRLMSVQLDEIGGALLQRKVEALGVGVLTGTATKEVVLGDDGRTRGLRFGDGGELAVDLVVFSAGIRPRDELAKSAGLTLGKRGGFVIDDHCRTSNPDILAIGECAAHRDRCYGLVAPGYRQADCAVAHLLGEDGPAFTGFDLSTTLKLMGVDVASFGDSFAASEGADVVHVTDRARGIYKKLVLSPDRKRLLGGILVGDISAYGRLTRMVADRTAVPDEPMELIVAARSGQPTAQGTEHLPDTSVICSCHNVTKGTIRGAIQDGRFTEVAQVKACTRAGTGCGSCATLIKDLLVAQAKASGIALNKSLCEHFAYSRQELSHLVRVHAIHDFATLLQRHGKGAGCEICKPAVASILASTWNEHVLDPRHRALQDTNDRYLANIQRDGTYSVVPRVPGGEITPEKLIVLGEVARRFGLYAKITGGQRVDLFGARVEQLPLIWKDLVSAGFESGHAYGKALRTVKSCVGSTWCRYGVQDSVGLAIRLENRYKGLRAPHKLKSAVSGCARECAEAQGKDFGVIASDRGYNLYLCGNGGMKPQHAQLFAVDIDEATVVKYLDRFLMFYIRTADRLERTAWWFNKLEGGLDYLKSVVIDDSLGICAELEADMARVVAGYRDEWAATLEDPAKLAHFRPFVNTDLPDPSIVMREERGQIRPATWAEKKDQLVPTGAAQ